MTLRCYRCGGELEGDEAVGMWISDFGIYVCMNREDCQERVKARQAPWWRIQRDRRKAATAAISNLPPGAEREAESA